MSVLSGWECPDTEFQSFQKADVKCALCGDKGHVTMDCKLAKNLTSEQLAEIEKKASGTNTDGSSVATGANAQRVMPGSGFHAPGMYNKHGGIPPPPSSARIDSSCLDYEYSQMISELNGGVPTAPSLPMRSGMNPLDTFSSKYGAPSVLPLQAAAGYMSGKGGAMVPPGVPPPPHQDYSTYYTSGNTGCTPGGYGGVAVPNMQHPFSVTPHTMPFHGHSPTGVYPPSQQMVLNTGGYQALSPPPPPQSSGNVFHSSPGAPYQAPQSMYPQQTVVGGGITPGSCRPPPASNPLYPISSQQPSQSPQSTSPSQQSPQNQPVSQQFSQRYPVQTLPFPQQQYPIGSKVHGTTTPQACPSQGTAPYPQGGSAMNWETCYGTEAIDTTPQQMEQMSQLMAAMYAGTLSSQQMEKLSQLMTALYPVMASVSPADNSLMGDTLSTKTSSQSCLDIKSSFMIPPKDPVAPPPPPDDDSAVPLPDEPAPQDPNDDSQLPPSPIPS